MTDSALCFNSFDHLPEIQNFGLSPVKVPCLEEHVPHDLSPFLTYPERTGWDHIELVYKGRVPQGRQLEDVESFLQMWLVFGLICETCRLTNVVFKQSHFLRRDCDGRLYVTTRALLDYIPQWNAAFESLEVQEAVTVLEAIETCVKVVATFAYRHIYKTGIFAQRCFVSLEVGLLIQIVGQTLQRMITNVRQAKSTPHAAMYIWWPMRYLEKRFITLAWCQFLAEKLQREFPIDTQYFATLLPLPASEATHRKCTKMACTINNIERATYVTRHQQLSCNCPFVKVDIDVICDILDGPGDHFPVLYFQNEAVTSLKAKAADGECSYIAISHVWSSGMGNLNQNSLPQCQLRYVRDQLHSISNQKKALLDNVPIAFWMDTLCVPVGETLWEQRTKAIARMRRTYEEAAAVLVLDSSLQQLSLRESSHVDLLLYIASSSWFTRLWTLQEGALAQRLTAAFRDGILDVDYFLRNDLSVNEWSLTGMHEPLRARITQIRGLLRQATPKERMRAPFSAILNLLRDRQTTRASDESICLSNLLGLDPTDVVNTSLEQGMTLFYRKVNQVPSLTLFLKGPRLSQPGLRWAPRSFLGAGDHQIRNIFGKSMCEISVEKGLKCPADFFVLSLSRLSKRCTPQSHTLPPSRRLFLKRPIKGLNSPTDEIYQLIISETWNSDEEQTFPLIPELKHAMVVCGQTIKEMHSTHGALLTLDVDRNSNQAHGHGPVQALHARYETTIQLWRMSPQQFHKLDKKLYISKAFDNGIDKWTDERGVGLAEIMPADTDLWIS